MSEQIALEVAAGVLVALTLGPLARRMGGSLSRVFVALATVLFLSLAAVAFEGAAFAPESVPPSTLPVMLATDLVIAAIGAGAIAAAFGLRRPVQALPAIPRRSWSSWLWRYLVSAFTYVVLYFVTGSLNYVLVTHPYYETHVGGLVVPDPSTVLLVCVVEGAMFPLALLPLLYALPLSRRDAALAAGITLFVLGGLVPLITVSPLPVFLRVASAWEILAQKLPVGVVSAYLLGPTGGERSAISGALAEGR